MSILDLILLSVALAMDCFTVSITSGLIQRRLVVRTMLMRAVRRSKPVDALSRNE